MKKISLVLALVLLVGTCLPASAMVRVFTPFSSTDKPTREYAVDDLGHIILQKGDIDEGTFCETVYTILQSGLREDLKTRIEKVSLVNNKLTIEVYADQADAGFLPVSAYIRQIVEFVTERILRYTDMDEYWDVLWVSFNDDLGLAAFTHEDIESNAYGGRYFNEEKLFQQIPD